MTVKRDKVVISCKQEDPQVDIEVNGKSYSCLVDSGATYSALTEVPPEGRKSQHQAEIVGIEGESEVRPFINECEVKLEGEFGTGHAFLYTPKCPVNLLGRDLLCKLRAQINFEPGKIDLTIPVQQMFFATRKVRDANESDFASRGFGTCGTRDMGHWPSQEGSAPHTNRDKGQEEVNLPMIRQRPISEAAVCGLVPLIKKYEQQGLIEICMS